MKHRPTSCEHLTDHRVHLPSLPNFVSDQVSDRQARIGCDWKQPIKVATDPDQR